MDAVSDGSEVPARAVPKGETHHKATLTERRVRKLKRRLARGESVVAAAEDLDIKYQVAYRIARGMTWAHVEPLGAVIKKGSARGPRRKLSLKLWYRVWQKRRARVSYAVLSEKLGMSTGSLHRLAREFEAMLAIRVSQLHLTSGSYEPAKRKYGLRRSEAERLDAIAASNPLSPRLQRIVDNEFEALEREISE